MEEERKRRQVATFKRKYGEDAYKRTMAMAGRKVMDLYGPEFFSMIGKKGAEAMKKVHPPGSAARLASTSKAGKKSSETFWDRWTHEQRVELGRQGGLKYGENKRKREQAEREKRERADG